MAETIATLLFYLFASLTILSGVMVISARNSVHSVFFLILAFFNSAGLFLLLGAEFIAMTLVIVYVGAVAVLFLFVVMMLDIDFSELRQGFLRYLPLGATVAVIVFFELFIVFYVSFTHPHALAPIAQAIPNSAYVSNTQAIGNVLYTWYLLPFQMAGIALLEAMIGAIVLTLRHRPDVRRQKVASQQMRRPADCITIMQVNTGEGIG